MEYRILGSDTTDLSYNFRLIPYLFEDLWHIKEIENQYIP